MRCDLTRVPVWTGLNHGSSYFVEQRVVKNSEWNHHITQKDKKKRRVIANYSKSIKAWHPYFNGPNMLNLLKFANLLPIQSNSPRG